MLLQCWRRFVCTVRCASVIYVVKSIPTRRKKRRILAHCNCIFRRCRNIRIKHKYSDPARDITTTLQCFSMLLRCHAVDRKHRMIGFCVCTNSLAHCCMRKSNHYNMEGETIKHSIDECTDYTYTSHSIHSLHVYTQRGRCTNTHTNQRIFETKARRALNHSIFTMRSDCLAHQYESRKTWAIML